MVLYRKYRPQRIEELDKEDIRTRLTAVFSSNHIPHAFLFAGPKGTGKTSASRIVAKIVNCEERKKTTIEPCNACANCIAVTSGTHLDVLEIDAASNRGIDEIRLLRERVNLSPAIGKKKIYIIDEVHMLTREAFNALLKTLEEPPAHVIFILATTEKDKLPGTILSRCTPFIFQRATDSELVHSLKRVVKGEKLQVIDDVLAPIAHAADGSFRDAVKLLEQALREDKLTIDGIDSFLGRDTHYQELLIFLEQKDVTQALSFIQTTIDSGGTVRQLVELLLEELHRTLLAKYGLEKERRTKAAGSWSIADCKRLIELLSKAYLEMKNNFIESLPLELAVIEYCGNSD